MDHALHIRPAFENSGMDEDFAVPPAGTGHHLAVEIDGEDIVAS